MPNPRDADLPARIARAMACVARWCERRLAEGVLDPHNYGRAVDALLKGAAASGTPAPEAVVEGLRAVLRDLTGNPLGFPQVDGQTNPHDLREMVQAFTELATVRDDRAARERLGRLLDTWIRLTNPDGTWRADLIAAEPSLKHPGFTDERDGIESPPPRSRARTVMALTHLFRLTGDQRALELAGRFVRLARTTSFTEDGRLTAQAGTHTHSITGTVQGLADYGLLIGDLDTVEHARRIFDVGLAPTCSSFGWSIESLGNERVPGRGEINNTGDMIQTAIILGLAGRPGYFGVAERMIRSHVLPSQWLAGQETLSPEDAPEYAVTEFPPEADGGWGFPSPSDRHVPRPAGRRHQRPGRRPGRHPVPVGGATPRLDPPRFGHAAQPAVLHGPRRRARQQPAARRGRRDRDDAGGRQPVGAQAGLAALGGAHPGPRRKRRERARFPAHPPVGGDRSAAGRNRDALALYARPPPGGGVGSTGSGTTWCSRATP